MMDVFDDRAGLRSTIVTSQLPVAEWHGVIADPSIADALLDRLVHHALRNEMKGSDAQTGTATHTQVDLKPIPWYW